MENQQKNSYEQFFQSSNMLEEIQPDELSDESELYVDDTFIKEIEEQDINQQLGIDQYDIEFFKKWNQFIKEITLIRKSQPDTGLFICKQNYKRIIEKFLEKYKNQLKEKNLRSNFIMLIVHLEQINVITSSDLLELTILYDNE